MAVSRCLNDEDRKYVEETRNDQGLHECEIFGKWSLELEEDYAWKNCKKTLNDHKNFIPFLEFSQQHLAEQYRHSQFLLEYIEVLASLTVRLRVHCVSENRPDGYPLACARGTDLRHLGTGWVYKVSQGQGRCPCGCFEYWWGIQIFTACHVVFDKKEAQKTEVDLFYDSESSNVTILYGHDVEDNSMSEDVCILHCYSHDKNLFESLEGIVNRYEVLKWDVPASLMSTLCVVISHPHGAPKKVTVGEMLGTAQCDPEKSLMSDFMFTYSADTCKGSSGAPVLAAISRKKLGASGVWPGAGPHSFRLTDELRQCGSGSFYMNADILSETMLRGNMQKLKIATEKVDVELVLLGNTGVGRSAVGNSILKEKVFATSSGVESETESVDIAISRLADGRTVKVVDTVGLNDTRMSQAESRARYAKQLDEIMSASTEQSLIFLLVFRFGVRFTQEHIDSVTFLKAVLGTDFVHRRCIMVMTFGDNYEEGEDDIGVSFKEWCQNQLGAFGKLAAECEFRVVLLNNKTKDKEVGNKQLADLFQAVDVLQAKESRYSYKDYESYQETRRITFLQGREQEIRQKVLQEESTLIEELCNKRHDSQALKLLFMRAKNLMRYVQNEDGGSGYFKQLMDRVKVLRKTIEETSKAQSEWVSRMVRITVRERMADLDIHAQREWFDRQLLSMRMDSSNIPGRSLDIRR